MNRELLLTEIIKQHLRSRSAMAYCVAIQEEGRLRRLTAWLLSKADAYRCLHMTTETGFYLPNVPFVLWDGGRHGGLPSFLHGR